MSSKIKDKLDFTKSICDKIHPLIEPLSQLFKIHTFGYRKFFPDGTSFNTSSNFPLTKFCQEKFDNGTIPTYEDEVSSLLNGEKAHFLRIGEPDKNNLFLSALYDLDIWNTLSLYRKSGSCVEGFYFTSTKDNHEIIEEYINNMVLFERFSFYFKGKFSDIMTDLEMKNARSPTISPTIFEKSCFSSSKDEQEIKNFISDTPINKFFLNNNGQDVSLSPQEFKCLALLSRGKTAKEIGRSLTLSSRTVESYIENIKCKMKVTSRDRLVDLFILNFHKKKDLLKYFENNNEEK